MIKKSFYTVLFVVCVLFVACRTQNSVISQGNSETALTGQFSPSEYLKKIQSKSCQEKNLVANIKCQVAMDSRDVSTKGQLRMRRDEVIQIILMDPVAGIMELGRIEFSPERMLMINRFNKNFMDVPYSDVEFLQKCNIDFNSLQHLFWNMVFVPSKRNVSESDFEFVGEGGASPSYTSPEIILRVVNRLLTYEFMTDPKSATLYETVIKGTNDPDSKLSFTYKDFKAYEGKAFPHDMCMSFIMGKKQASIQFTINSLKDKSGWETKSSVSSKYTQVDPEKIFKSLVGN